MSFVAYSAPVSSTDHVGNRPKYFSRAGSGWVLWTVFALAVAASQFSVPASRNNVFQIYRDAGRHWLEGQPLYDRTGYGFIYLPQCAVLFVPFAYLPYQWGGVLWRILNIGVFAVGVWRFVRLAERDESPGGSGATVRVARIEETPARQCFFDQSPSMFPLVTLIVVLLSWSAGRYGQMTMTMGGLMLLTVVDLVDRRWWRAVLWMTLGLAVKPLMIVLMLLAAVLYPRTSWRMALAVAVLAVFPLLAQHHEYVLDQYRASITMFDDVTTCGATNRFPHLFWVLKSSGLDIPAPGQTALRMLAALATLALCWRAQRKYPAARAGVLLYTVAIIYLLLFNPRTEHNMYCLLAPALGVFAVQAIATRHRVVATLLIGMAMVMLLGYPLGHIVPTIWLKPLVCIVFLAVVLWQFASTQIAEPVVWREETRSAA